MVFFSDNLDSFTLHYENDFYLHFEQLDGYYVEVSFVNDKNEKYCDVFVVPEIFQIDEDKFFSHFKFMMVMGSEDIDADVIMMNGETNIVININKALFVPQMLFILSMNCKPYMEPKNRAKYINKLITEASEETKLYKQLYDEMRYMIELNKID